MRIPDPESTGTHKRYAEITHVRRAKVAELLKTLPSIQFEIEQQIGRKADAGETVTVLQLKQVYEFEVERRLASQQKGSR